ncbi:MAG: nucleoside-diphosphate kinase [Erysipelotrichaceae bacterium]
MYKTFIMIKPDSANNPVTVAQIFNVFRDHRLKVKHIKEVIVDRDLILAHYDEVIEHQAEKDAFASRVLREFEGQKVIIAMVYGKGDVIARVRKLVGVTQPLFADPRSIRGRFGRKDSYAQANAEDRVVRNVIHASDSSESVRRESALWYLHLLD